MRSLHLRARAGRAWRGFTRMRTAIFLLIGVVLFVLIGSFVPQQHTSGQDKVDQFLLANQHLVKLGQALGLDPTEVFVSPDFYILLGALFIALGACVLRRARALVVRTVRHYRRTPQYLGEIGSWVFHASFFLLLFAVVWGKSTGFQGLTTIVEGQRFTEARAGYDDIQEGLLFNGQHEGFQVQLNHFTATYDPTNGQPSDYVSNVTVYDSGKPVETKDIRVNEFLAYKGVDLYQQDFGWAPEIRVTNPQGVVVYDSAVEMFSSSAKSGKAVQTGVLKVPDFGYTIPGAKQPLQIGARLAIFPDARVQPHVNSDGTIDPTQTEYTPGGQDARNPVLQVQLFAGDLGLNGGAAQNVNSLNTAQMKPYFGDAHTLPLPLGQSLELPLPGADGKQVPFTISFPALHQYSLFMVKKDDGVPLVYVSFFLIITGLLTKLYVRPLLESRKRRGTESAEDEEEPPVAAAVPVEAEPHEPVPAARPRPAPRPSARRSRAARPRSGITTVAD